MERGKRGFRLLAGSEINIGLDGSLDYPDDLVAALDWVVASVHTSFSISEKEMTERVVAAIENPRVDCIGHLTGRLIGRREPYGIDVEAVAEAAARTGTMLEINGNPNRRDLSDRHARLAVDAGATIVLNTDAHGVDTLDNMAYAVATARRAWLTAADVANTRGWREFKQLLSLARRPSGPMARQLLALSGPRLAVAAQPRRPHQFDRAQGRVGDDVELDAVAVLDAEHRGLTRVPGERDDQGVAGADHGEAGEEEAEAAGDDSGQRDRPEPADGDSGRSLGGQRGGGAGTRERVADVVGGAGRAAEPEADRQRRHPPDRRDQDRRRVPSRLAPSAVIAPSAVASAPVTKTVTRSRSV